MTDFEEMRSAAICWEIAKMVLSTVGLLLELWVIYQLFFKNEKKEG